MNIHVIQNQKDLLISEDSVVNLVQNFIDSANVSFDEVTIHFVDTKIISNLHAEFFDDPSPTDCITFPMDSIEEDGYKVMGDVFVCPKIASQYIETHGGDVYKETTLYVIHGLLHLLGYDDIEENEEKEMRAAETSCLKQVEQKKLWLQAI